jgi:hypothetical protein
MAGGCDGFGACKPAAMGTVCGSNVCSNGPDTVGQWASPAFYGVACDGVTPGASGCKAGANTGCAGHFACASGSACKTTCSLDADCVNGYYCSSGVCMARKTSGACARDFECASLACFSGNCADCYGLDNYQCPVSSPACLTGNKCGACNYAPYCLNDGTGRYDCRKHPFCPARAPSCGTDGVCRCGTADVQCPIGTICLNGACKLGGTQPCVQASDCAYGTCTNGLCPKTPLSGICFDTPGGTSCDPAGAATGYVPSCDATALDSVPVCEIDTS